MPPTNFGRIFSFIYRFILAIGLGFWPAVLVAQTEREGIYLIYDSSNSMWGELPDKSRKYEAARIALSDLVGRDIGARDIALRMYGHSRRNDCSDTSLVVPFASLQDNEIAILDAIQAVRPTGRTPIDLSLRAALDDFGTRRGKIILISDGIESCDADPCALVRSWQDKDIDIDVHVVGLGLKGKERAAMQCIADAAGTEYLDASSSIELSESLEKATANNSGAVAPRAPDPKPSVARPDVVLEMRGPDGELYRGAGILMPIDGGEPIPLESYKRHQVPAGDYNFSGGIVTVSGEIYEPQERMVTIAAETRFVLAAEGPLPPQVTASFQMAGEEIRETVVTVYRDGKKLGSFHGDEVGFVPEGALEFQTDIAASNQTLSVNETFVAGDVKVISFDAKKEVKLIVALILDATGERLRGKPAPELLQNGEVVTKINASSGGFVTPGQYVFRADDGLNLYSQDLSVSDEDTQEIEIKVPSGAIVVIYQDVSGAQEEPKRIFLRRADDNRGVTRSSNEPVGLLPGRYVLTGHPKAAGYPETAFEITAGETKEIVLQATN